jgi:hypothetical protein
VTWTDIWFWWLLAILVSWLVLEVGSILVAKARGQGNIFEWTLSDTIRRWSAAHRLIAPLACGTVAFLLYHFFMQLN